MTAPEGPERHAAMDGPPVGCTGAAGVHEATLQLVDPDGMDLAFLAHRVELTGVARRVLRSS